MTAAAKTTMKTVAAVADRFKPRRRGITVLIYHRVGSGSGIQVDLPIRLFEQQMDVLAASGRVVSLDAALDALVSPVPPPMDPVVVTFDDGTADFVDTALPAMTERGIASTLYVATQHVEEGLAFPHGGRPLSWAGLREALSTGMVTIGSHTHRHALLDRVDGPTAAEELDRSCDLLATRLHVAVDHFAYPKALIGSAAAQREVRSRFRSAALAGCRTNRYGRTDPHRLARSPIQVADGMRWFARKLDGGMALEDALRRLVNRRRYAGAAT
ncbi:polysaccharide deacetylase family protein [soil metagenome]